MTFKTVQKRRLSLMAGGSLAAWLLLAGAVTITPTPAMAANECGDPTGPDTDTLTCSGEKPSISYVPDGNLTLLLDDDLAVTTGGLTVTETDTDQINIFGGASIDGTDFSIVNTAGAGLHVDHSGTVGDLGIFLFDDDTDGRSSITGTTQGILIEATGTNFSQVHVSSNVTATDGNGFEGVGWGRFDGSVSGLITATGTGMRITAGGQLFASVNDVNAAVGVHLQTTGVYMMGLTTYGDVAATSDTAILLDPTGLATLRIEASSLVTGLGQGAGVVRVTNANSVDSGEGGGLGFIFDNVGVLRSSDATVGGYDDLVIEVLSGDGPVEVRNGGTISGRVEINSTGVTQFGGGVWHTTGDSLLGAGQGIYTGGTLLATNANGAATSIDLGNDGSFRASGVVAVGEGTEAPATLQLLNVGEWVNRALVLFGSNGDYTWTDGVANDRIVALGTDFEGMLTTQGRAIGTLVMDVDFHGQADCSAAVTADCMDLSGGTTSGITKVIINPIGTGFGDSSTIALIDLGGDTGAQGDFEIDPLSPNYRAPPVGEDAGKATVDAGLFRYALRYLPDAGQHALVSIPDVEVGELGLIGDAALAAWDLSAGTWLQRQADLRDNISANAPDHLVGAWLKVARNKIDYTLIQHYSAFSADYAYNTSYAQETTSIVGGVDLLSTMGEGKGWVVGVMGSKTTSDLDFRTSPTTVNLEGYSIGAYASLVGGLWYLDALVNSTKLNLEYDSAPLMDTGEVSSLGFDLEGGFRFVLADGLAFAEPLVALSHVTTEFPDLNFADVDVVIDENTTSRGALGLRIGGRLPLETWTAAISGTGRVWQEFEGEDRVTLHSNGPDAGLITDTGDVLGDIGGQLGVFSNDLRFSASVEVRHQFKQDYSSTDLALSLRYWF